MLTKDDLLAAMLRECDICLHLHTKVPEGGFDFRFTPPQRSTLELLRYISYVGIGATRGLIEGNWEVYAALEKEAENLDASGVRAAIERQKAALAETFGGLMDDDFANRKATLPWGAEVSLGRAVLDLAHASLVAYRMQLFLQAKAAGNASIGTPNCWGGMDMPESDPA